MSPRLALILVLMLGRASPVFANGIEWGAIATGVILDSATKSGASAFSIRFRATREEAERTALAGCEARAAKQNPRPTCTISAVWNHGCEYAVIGEQWPPGAGVASVGVGTSSKDAQIALYDTISDASGLFVHPVMGGCLE